MKKLDDEELQKLLDEKQIPENGDDKNIQLYEVLFEELSSDITFKLDINLSEKVASRIQADTEKADRLIRNLAISFICLMGVLLSFMILLLLSPDVLITLQAMWIKHRMIILSSALILTGIQLADKQIIKRIHPEV